MSTWSNDKVVYQLLPQFFFFELVLNNVQMLQTYCKCVCAFLRRKKNWQIDCFSELRNISDYHEYLIKW